MGEAAMASLTIVAQDIRRLAGCEPSDEQLLAAFTQGQEPAFAALVRRYAGLVMGVCRRALGHEQDAEDAFQATFLVLARNARSIRRAGSLTAWLHGVAHRVARSARRDLARRREKERRGARAETTAMSEELSWREVQALLDEEVERLPDGYRDVFVLCCLQERSKPEAARLLGLKEGTVSSRLARSRRQVQEGLARRGVNLAALLAVGVGNRANAALVKAAAALAGDSEVPVKVAALADGAAWGAAATKGKMALAVMFIGVMLAPLAAGPKPEAQAREVWPPARAAGPGAEEWPAQKESTASGVVLDPDGKPLRGANVAVRVTSPDPHAGGEVVSATTDADGRFRLAFRKGAYQDAVVVASAAGFGPEWSTSFDKPLTLKLAKDHPVTGKVVDLEGRPVPNARLRVVSVIAPKEGTIESALAKHEDGEWSFRMLAAQALPDRLQSARADAKGSLRLGGLGHDRLIVAVIEGPTIASSEVWILSGPATAPKLKKLPPVYLAAFTHAAAPMRPVVGLVRDSKTKKPLVGVTVRCERLAKGQSWFGSRYVEAKTDAAGKYRLVGMPTGRENWIVVEPPADQPYLAVQLELPDPVGIDPMTLNVDLRRGLWAEGRVTVKETGQPAPHVQLQYFAQAGNPHLVEVVGAFRGRLFNQPRWTGEDGRYRLAVLPGEGAIVGYARGQYLTLWERPGVSREKLQTTVLQTVGLGDFHYFAQINPKGDADRFPHDLNLLQGETLKVKLIDPEGKPVAGARSLLAGSGVAQWEGQPSAECVVGAFNRKAPRRVQFIHLQRNLAGALKVPDDGTSEVVIQLRPAGTLVGQLVDEGGTPRPGVQMHVFGMDFPGPRLYPASQGQVRTGDRGEFRVTGLLPGVDYLIGPIDGASISSFRVKEGETKDLGKVKQPR
jgi:RNA polymerase sigma factor (sigma-70 family)